MGEIEKHGGKPPEIRLPSIPSLMSVDSVGQPDADFVELSLAHDARWHEKIGELGRSITSQQGRLIKAVVTDDDIYVSGASVPASVKDKMLTLDDVEDFVDLAETDPTGLIAKQDKMIRTISREKDLHPEDWQWTGRRAMYQVARARLNQSVNESFGTKVPVLESELSPARIMAKLQEERQDELRLKPLEEQ